jgi:hypothetical protein
MSFPLSLHQGPLGSTGAYWLDDPPDLNCKDSTRQHAVDDARLSCTQQVGGSSPPSDTTNTPTELHLNLHGVAVGVIDAVDAEFLVELGA